MCWKTFTFGPWSFFSKWKWIPAKKSLSSKIEAANKDVKSRINFAGNDGYNILRIDTLPIFFSRKLKRNVIITNKHGIYELLRDLPNDLRLRILGNYDTSGKPQNIIKL